jgi:hypothetical protein
VMVAFGFRSGIRVSAVRTFMVLAGRWGAWGALVAQAFRQPRGRICHSQVIEGGVASLWDLRFQEHQATGHGTPLGSWLQESGADPKRWTRSFRSETTRSFRSETESFSQCCAHDSFE